MSPDGPAYRICPLSEATCRLELTISGGRVSAARGNALCIFSHGFICPVYMPASWLADPERCRDAEVPENLEFATKPEHAKQIIVRAIEAGVPFRWVTAIESCTATRRRS